MIKRVPYIDLEREYAHFRDRILDATNRVMASGSFILREDVTLFEERICQMTDADHCIGVNSGYDALYLALRMLDLEAGDEVILPSYTFIATASAVVQAGGVPVFADIRDDLNIDPGHVRKLITEKTRSIIPVHLNGVPCDMPALKEIAVNHGLSIIEDAAQAIGSTLDGSFTGTLGDYGCFSMHPLKTLSVPGDGGFILCRDDNAAARLRSLRDHGRAKGTHEVAGINSRLDNLHAAVANVKLDDFSVLAEGRRKAAAMYRDALGDDVQVRLLEEPQGSRVVWSNFPVITDDADRLEAELRDAGIEVFRHFKTPVHALPAFSGVKARVPVTEQLCVKTVHLPIHPFLTEAEVALVADTIQKVV